MSRLVAVQRADKNGVMVTRHVRADQTTKASSATLKSAVPVIASERTRQIGLMTALLNDEANEIKLDTLNDQQIACLAELTEYMNSSGVDDNLVIKRLLNPKRTASERYMEVEDFPPLSVDLRNLAQYHRLDRGVPLSGTLSFARGLQSYDHVLAFDPALYNLDEEKKQAIIDVSITALQVLGEKSNAFDYPDDDMNGELRNDLDMFYSFFGGDLDNQRDGQMWIRNPKFMSLLLSRPEDAGRISAFIVQRQTIQPDIIEVMLDSDNHEALMEGTL